MALARCHERTLSDDLLRCTSFHRRVSEYRRDRKENRGGNPAKTTAKNELTAPPMTNPTTTEMPGLAMDLTKTSARAIIHRSNPAAQIMKGRYNDGDSG
jgi:hypothetical protein